MFLNDSAMDSTSFFWNKKEVKGALWENILLTDLLGSHNLLEIFQTSLTFKNSEKVVKSGCFKKRLQWRALMLFRIKKRYKVSCV